MTVAPFHRRPLSWLFRVALLALAACLQQGCVLLSADEASGRIRLAGSATPSAADATGDAPVDAGELAAAPDAGARGDLPGVARTGGATARLTATLLQSELLAFADRYLEAVAEASDRGAGDAASARERAGFRQLKVVYVTAAITTVTEPEPLRVLRDLLVMLRLQRMVWDRGDHEWASAAAATRMKTALTALEAQLLKLGGLVYAGSDIALIHELTQRWHTANPDRRYVAFVRFHDFDDSELKRHFEQRTRRAGLLAPINKAADELQEMRRISERALFLANHMPMLLEWQAEAYLHEALSLPEVEDVAQNFARVSSAAEALSGDIGALPAHVAQEREATLNALAALVAREREATLTQIDEKLDAQRRALVGDLGATAGELGPLVEHIAQASAAIHDSLKLLAALEDGAGDAAFDLAELDVTVRNMTRLATDSAVLTESLRGLLADRDSASSGLARLDALLAAHERRLFGYAAILVALGGGLLCLAAVLWRRAPASS